jgi:hypothetical protein
MKKILFSVFALASAMSAKSQINDPSFEAGIGGGVWLEYSSYFGTPLCDATCGATAYDGTFYAWFGGAGTGVAEDGHLSQQVLFTNGATASLSFYVLVGNVGDGGEDRCDVFVDGDVLHTVYATDSASIGGSYAEMTLDLSAYTDGDAHVIGINGYSTNGSSILFDTFSLSFDGAEQVGINELLNNEANSTVYPNPATNQLNLQFGSKITGETTVVIYDMNGKIVRQDRLMEVQNTTFSFDASALANGVYSVKVLNNGSVENHSVVVAH